MLICPKREPFTYKLMKLLHQNTQPNNKLFPFSYTTYNNSFQQAERHFGLNLHMTAHSGRAGFATSRIMAGAEAKQVQAEGRWAAESSFRTYIDVVGSLHTKSQVELGGLLPAALWCQAHIEDYFTNLTLVNDTSSTQKQSRQCRGDETARPPPQGEPLFGASSSRPLHQLPETAMARRTSRQVEQQEHSHASQLRPTASGKGKGRGRGKLLAVGRAPQSIFD